MLTVGSVEGLPLPARLVCVLLDRPAGQLRVRRHEVHRLRTFLSALTCLIAVPFLTTYPILRLLAAVLLARRGVLRLVGLAASPRPRVAGIGLVERSLKFLAPPLLLLGVAPLELRCERVHALAAHSATVLRAAEADLRFVLLDTLDHCRPPREGWQPRPHQRTRLERAHAGGADFARCWCATPRGKTRCQPRLRPGGSVAAPSPFPPLRRRA